MGSTQAKVPLPERATLGAGTAGVHAGSPAPDLSPPVPARVGQVRGSGGQDSRESALVSVVGRGPHSGSASGGGGWGLGLMAPHWT